MEVGEVLDRSHQIGMTAHHLPRRHHLADPAQSVDPRQEGLVQRRLLLQPGKPAVDRLEVCDRQLGLDHLDVAARVEPFVDMDHVGRLEGPDHVADGAHLADGGQELVAEPLTLAGALHQTGDVDEGHRGVDHLLGSEDLGETLDPRIGDGHHSGVRLDRGERVVGGEDPGLGQCVEQGGLADVGETDDADGECHVGRGRLGA